MNVFIVKEIKKKLSKKKLIIFDYDGTIADTNELHDNAFKSTLEGYLKDFEYYFVHFLY